MAALRPGGGAQFRAPPAGTLGALLALGRLVEASSVASCGAGADGSDTAEAGTVTLQQHSRSSEAALFKGDDGVALRKHAASTESAWQDCGQKAGVDVRRNEDFQVKKWPEAKPGRTHEGNSYTVFYDAARVAAEGSEATAEGDLLRLVKEPASACVAMVSTHNNS